MSIPKLDLAPANRSELDPSTDLISRLAQDLYRSRPSAGDSLPGQGWPSSLEPHAALPEPAAPPSALPAQAAWPQSNLQGSPLSSGNSVSTGSQQPTNSQPANGSRNRDIALSGGFPDAAASAPPVHPTVVAVEPATVEHHNAAEEKRPASGTHRPGDPSSHEFGEPSFYGHNLRKGSANPTHSGGHNSHASATPSADPRSLPALPGWPASPDQPSYYFLNHLPQQSPSVPTHPPTLPGVPLFDIDAVRADFPALHQQVNGKPLVWLDNAATTHKPRRVIEETSRFYAEDNSNIHRAAHSLAARSTDLFEAGRESVRRFLGAADAKEIVFVRGTTEAINLVAQSWGKQNIGAGDEILLSQLEHHANIVPWQLLAEQVGAKLRVIPINDRGELILEQLPSLLTERTKILSITHVSNALGTINPIEQIIPMAHARGIPVLIDAAQSTPHFPINVQALDADFLVFSGHKVFAPTGIGTLYGKAALLEAMPPWQGGGHMIKDVSFEKTIFNAAPEKFEAGTPDIAGVVGLGAALEYLMALGLPALAAYEHSLLDYAQDALRSLPGIRPIGTAANKASVFGFVIPGLPNERVAKELDRHGIAVRAGHHCAMPAVRHFGVEGTIRPSLAFYNNRADVDALIHALRQITKFR